MRDQAQKYFMKQYETHLATTGNYKVDAFEQAREDLMREFGDSYDVDYPAMVVEYANE